MNHIYEPGINPGLRAKNLSVAEFAAIANNTGNRPG